MTSQKKRLALSFGNLISQIDRGSLQPADLAGVLFYVGCARSDLELSFDQYPAVRAQFELDRANQATVERAQKIYSELTGIIFTAEKEGRAVFRTQKGDCQYEQLNSLLTRHGVDVSSVRDLEIQPYTTTVVMQRYDSLVDIIDSR